MAYVTHTIVDYSNERSFTRHHLPNVTPANFDAITGNGATDNVGALRLALAAITDGNFVKHEVTTDTTRTVMANFPIVNENAQREIKVILRFLSVAGRAYSVEVPAPILDNVGTPGTDVIDPDTDWLAFINLITANLVDGYGDAVAFLDGRVVGRRL